ncbi:hypothetical protein ACP70R_047323 [Stipagrostis hirtigluma subsp. patula]
METASVQAGVRPPFLLLGLPAAEARAEDIEYVLGDVLETLSRIDSKRGRLQGQIAAASRGKQRRRASSSSSRRSPPAAAHGAAPVPPAADDDHGACGGYTRRGACGTVRRRLRAAAGDAKKERERLEAVWGDLEEALVDARERLALHPAGGATAAA